MTTLQILKEISTNRAVTALVWTLFHSLWEGALLAIAAGVILSVTGRATAVLRYNLLCGLLFLLAGVTILTFCYQYQLQPLKTVFFFISVKLSPVVHLRDHLPGVTNIGLLLKGLTRKTADLISQHSVLIGAIWLAFSLIKSLKLIFNLNLTRLIRDRKSSAPAGLWMKKLDELHAQMSVSRPVLLLETAVLNVPAVYGYFKPVIFIPLGLISKLPATQIEVILLHELAHIRRNDYLVNLLQQIVEVIFFFNPALSWLSARIRQEREHCCDELAVAQTGDRKNYAEALIGFKELLLNNSIPGTLAFTGARSDLLSRVSHLICKQNPTLNLAEKSALFSCGLALLFFLGFYTTPSAPIPSPVTLSARQSYTDFPLGKVISGVSEDLIKNGLIGNTNRLSFALTNTELLVNGVRQPNEVWLELYGRYLKFSPYPIKPELRNEPGFGIFYNSARHIYGIGTAPPAWNN